MFYVHHDAKLKKKCKPQKKYLEIGFASEIMDITASVVL